MKGCLLNIIKKVLLIGLIVAFFAFGGYAFVKDKIKNYQYPTREEFIETEKNYGDFSNIPSDYQLYRSFDFFGYKKINAKYLPTGQKITILNLKDEDLISVSDFYNDEISTKIQKIINKAKNAVITYENFEFIKKGRYLAGKDIVPYVTYKATVKNIPFKEVVGTIAAYSSQNEEQQASTKLIFSIVDNKAYNPKIVHDFVNSLRIK